MKILIAEDTEDSRIMLEMALASQNFEVISTSNGMEALQLTRTTSPDLIISDIMMPKMDGFELCRQLKLDPKLRKIPLIFYTATYTEQQDRRLAMALGASRFIIKPIDPEKLITIIHEVLETSKIETTSVPPELQKDEYELKEMHLHSIGRKLDKKVKELEQAEKDLQARKKELRESEERYRSMLMNLTESFYSLTLDSKLLDYNTAFTTLLKLDPGKNHKGFEIPNFWQNSEDKKIYTQEFLKNGFVNNYIVNAVKTDGEKIIIRIDSRLIKDEEGNPNRIDGTFLNITKQKKAEKQIQKDLQEKTLLMQEIYHRTKNNMQVIYALLSMEGKRSNNESLKNTFKEINNKIKSMSLVHQMLYDAEDLSNINLKEYIENLLKLLSHSYGIQSRKVNIKCELDDVSILIDSAIPLGIILNELVSNVFKHAFPENREGEIFIRLHEESNGTIDLQLEDNGVGLPNDFNLKKDGSMGLSTVFNIVEHQLNGKIRYDKAAGLKWHIKLKNNLYKQRV